MKGANKFNVLERLEGDYSKELKHVVASNCIVPDWNTIEVN